MSNPSPASAQTFLHDEAKSPIVLSGNRCARCSPRLIRCHRSPAARFSKPVPRAGWLARTRRWRAASYDRTRAAALFRSARHRRPHAARQQVGTVRLKSIAYGATLRFVTLLVSSCGIGARRRPTKRAFEVPVVPALVPLPYARNERLHAWVMRPALASVVAHCRKAIQPWDMWIVPHIGD
jgi:hypothetical protein